MRWHDRIVATVEEGAGVDEHHLDDIYAFFLTCLQLGDWPGNDRRAGISKKDVTTLIDREHALSACADIANGVQHLVRHEGRARPHPLAYVTLAGSVAEDGRFDAESAVVFTGEVEDALPIVRECVTVWQRFLEERGLLPLERRG